MKLLSQNKFPINAAGTDIRVGQLMVPNDFETNPEPCKLIVFSHGSGEYGLYGDLSGISKLYMNGSPLAQAKAGLLESVICPITGKVIRVAVLALQGLNGWCCQANETVAAIKLLLPNYPNIDPKGMLATGLSAGGEITFELIGGPDGGMFVAGVPLSCAPAPNDTIINWPSSIAKVWALHGDTDSTGITNNGNSVKAVNQVNGAHPGFAYYNTYPGGHCCWDTVYTPNYKKLLPVKNITKPVNIYEFWAAVLTSNILFTDSGTSAGSGGINPNQVATKAIFTASFSGNTIILDGSASIGNGGIGSYSWGVTGPSKPAWPNGRSDGGGQPGIVSLSNMNNGSYTIALVVYDRLGGSNSSVQTLIVGGTTSTTTTTTTTIVKTSAILAVIYNSKTGHQIIVNDDDSISIK